MRTSRPLAVAQHEAAHVVVGGVLGLRLKSATARASGADSGHALWDARYGTTEAFGIMLAAGVAWERNVTGSLGYAGGDLAAMRRMGIGTPARVAALAYAAWSILGRHSGAHARVTRVLLAETEIDGAWLARLGLAAEWGL